MGLSRIFLLSRNQAIRQLETLLLPPGNTAAETSRPAKIARPALSKYEFLRLCRSGNAGEIEAALKNGADANTKDDNGRTALMLAIIFERAEAEEIFLKYGADVNARDDEGYTALLYAACFGYSKVAKILLQNGAKVNITYRDPNYSDGVTVLHVAKMNRNDETANVILSFGGEDSHPITTAINETVNTVTDFISSIFS